MSVHLSKTLYVRVDRPLRADLLSAAEAAGQSVSAFARGALRSALECQSSPQVREGTPSINPDALAAKPGAGRH